MLTRAIVLMPSAAETKNLLRPIAGVPALLRTLLSAQRAGVNEILLVGKGPFEPLRQPIAPDRRLLARLHWVTDQPWAALTQAVPELETGWLEGGLWVLPAGAVIDATLLREVAQRAVSQPIAVVEEWPRPQGEFRVSERRISQLETRNSTLETAPAVFRVAGPWLRQLLDTSGNVPLSVALSALPQRRNVEYVANNGRLCAPVVGKHNREGVERQLFVGLQSSSDGWVDRYVNRQLSRFFSRWLLRTPLTPNHVTLISLAIGLMAALSFAWGGWLSGVIGALLLQWSAVVDCCDGEVARLKFLESPAGYYLDIACDNVVHVAVFVGIAWSVSQGLGSTHSLALGGLAAVGTIMSFLVVVMTRHGGVQNASGGLDRVIDALTNRDFSIFLLLCALAGVLQWFLWVLAIGVNLFWPTVLGLAWRARRTAHG